jgi:hypothetical protein
MTFTLIPNRSLTVIDSDNKVYTARSDNPNWDKLIEAVKADNESEVLRLINLKHTVMHFADEVTGAGLITVENGVVAYRGCPLHGLDVDRVISFFQQGIPRGGMVNFLERKMKNTSYRSIEQLYHFLETKGEGSMPVTPAGTFIGYKGVNPDFSSKNTGHEPLISGKRLPNGSIDNHVGEVVRMERQYVCDDPRNGCAAGLHVGSLRYATDWADRDGKVVLVEVDPADVVSVPATEDEKMRCCAYRVVGVYDGPLPETYTTKYTPSQAIDDGDDDDSGSAGDSCPICGEDHDESDCPDNYDNDDGNGTEYDSGYEEGYEEGKADAEEGADKEGTTPTAGDDSYQAGWNDGYNAGYDENDTI